MKTYFLTIGSAGVFCAVAFSQSAAENDLYERLSEDGPGSVEALETVLKKPDEYSAFILYKAAMVTFAEERLEDSGFLFHAAKLRAHFDGECFPPKGTGGNSPFTALSALDSMFGMYIPPAVAAKPKAFEGFVGRLKAWTPKAPADYDPGYEYKERRPEKEAYEVVRAAHKEYLDGMTGLAVLLNDTEYFAAFRVVQAYNLEPRDKRPTKKAHEEAMDTMRRIEKEKGIEGFSEEPDDSPAAEVAEPGARRKAVRCLRKTARRVPRRNGRRWQRVSDRRQCGCSSTGIRLRHRCTTHRRTVSPMGQW